MRPSKPNLTCSKKSLIYLTLCTTLSSVRYTQEIHSLFSVIYVAPEII